VVIWAATVAANIGTWMYSAAAGWLMTELSVNPLMVSLVQVATSLPLLLFALPAGALADIVDKRRLLIVGESAIPSRFILPSFTFILSSQGIEEKLATTSLPRRQPRDLMRQARGKKPKRKWPVLQNH
jgi:MFS family permease